MPDLAPGVAITPLAYPRSRGLDPLTLHISGLVMCKHIMFPP